MAVVAPKLAEETGENAPSCGLASRQQVQSNSGRFPSRPTRARNKYSERLKVAGSLERVAAVCGDSGFMVARKALCRELNLTRSGYLGANAGHICKTINFKQSAHGKYV